MPRLLKLASLIAVLLTLSAASDVAYCQYRDVVRTAAYNSTAPVAVPILPSDPPDAAADTVVLAPPATTPVDAPPADGGASAAPAYAPAAAAPTASSPTPAYAPPATSQAFVSPFADERFLAAGSQGLAPAPPAFNPAAIAPLASLGPVPYYSNLFDQAMAEPPVVWFEEPGLKQGWLFSAGTGLFKPYIHSTQSSAGLVFAGPIPAVPGPVFAGVVQLPVAQPGWTAMPDLQLAYRFERGLGELRANFRFLGNQGTATIAGFDPAGAGVLTSRLRVDVLDLQYANTEALPVRLPLLNPLLLIPGRLGLNIHQENQPTYPPILFTYAIGVRLASVFYDSTAVGALLAERSMNNFTGAGPECGFQVQTPTRWRAITLHSKLLTAGVLGKDEQSFSAAGPAAGAPGVASSRVSDGIATLDVEFGLSYVPKWRQCLCRFTGGYAMQQWWFLGGSPSGGTVGELSLQGMFFRGELGF